MIARSDCFRPIGASTDSNSPEVKELGIIYGDNKFVSVTRKQLKWEQQPAEWSLPLPHNWRELSLNESGEAVNVLVDGKKWITIYPSHD